MWPIEPTEHLNTKRESPSVPLLVVFNASHTCSHTVLLSYSPSLSDGSLTDPLLLLGSHCSSSLIWESLLAPVDIACLYTTLPLPTNDQSSDPLRFGYFYIVNPFFSSEMITGYFNFRPIPYSNKKPKNAKLVTHPLSLLGSHCSYRELLFLQGVFVLANSVEGRGFPYILPFHFIGRPLSLTPVVLGNFYIANPFFSSKMITGYFNFGGHSLFK